MKRRSIVKFFLGVTGPFLGTHLVSSSRPQVRILAHTVWLPGPAVCHSDPTHLIKRFSAHSSAACLALTWLLVSDYVLAGFMPPCHNLESFQKMEPQLRKCPSDWRLKAEGLA